MVAVCVVGSADAALAGQCAVESVRRWVSEAYNMVISNSLMQWVLLCGWYCSQLGYCLTCWVWSCWVPLGTNTRV